MFKTLQSISCERRYSVYDAFDPWEYKEWTHLDALDVKNRLAAITDANPFHIEYRNVKVHSQPIPPCHHDYRPGMALIPTKHISADFIGDAVLDTLEFAYYDQLPAGLQHVFRGQTISMGDGVFKPVQKCTRCGHSLYTPKET